jgi:pantothenate kinase-related protein Tda10
VKNLPLSVRLDKETESLLKQTASALHTTKARVIKESLADYCTRILVKKRSRPYDLIQDLLGGEGSGKGDLSIRGEEILRNRLRRKE